MLIFSLLLVVNAPMSSLRLLPTQTLSAFSCCRMCCCCSTWSSSSSSSSMTDDWWNEQNHEFWMWNCSVWRHTVHIALCTPFDLYGVYYCLEMRILLVVTTTHSMRAVSLLKRSRHFIYVVSTSAHVCTFRIMYCFCITCLCLSHIKMLPLIRDRIVHFILLKMGN